MTFLEQILGLSFADDVPEDVRRKLLTIHAKYLLAATGGIPFELFADLDTEARRIVYEARAILHREQHRDALEVEDIHRTPTVREVLEAIHREAIAKVKGMVAS